MMVCPLQVYAFYQVTQPASAAAAALQTGSQHRQPHCSRAQEGGRQRRPVTASSDVPPHAFCKQGQLSGVVYTVALSKFAPTDTIADWPPATSGPQAFAKKWRASVSQGTLVLTPLVEPPAATGPQAKRQGAGKQAGAGPTSVPPASAASASQLAMSSTAEAGEPADASQATLSAEQQQDQQQQHPGGEPATAAAAAPAAKVGIPLEGCRVEVVAGGLKGRSRWIRRAPLLVTHPRWNLLDGERGFYILAGAPLRPMKLCAGTRPLLLTSIRKWSWHH